MQEEIYKMKDGREVSLFQNDLPDNASFEDGSSVAIDTEAMGLESIRDRLCVVQIADNKGQLYLVQFRSDSQYKSPNLAKLLTNDKILKIMHFARFDMRILQKYITPVLNIFCTHIASRLIRTYTNQHSLKALCRELLDKDMDKSMTTSDWGADKLTVAQMEYAIGDVLYLHGIHEAILKTLQREKRENLARDTMNALQNRVDLDLAGWETVDLFSHHRQFHHR